MKNAMQSIGVRFLLAVFLILTIAGIILNRTTLEVVRAEILQRSIIQYQQIVENEAMLMDAAITEGSLLALALAHSPELQNLVSDPHLSVRREEAENRLKSFLATNRRFSGAAIISAHYELLVSVAGDESDLTNGQAFWAASFARGVDPFNAMARIPVFIDQIPIPAHDITQTRYLVPILDRDTILRGILALDLNLGFLLEGLHFSHLTYDFMVLDEHGQIILQRPVVADADAYNRFRKLQSQQATFFVRNPRGSLDFAFDDESFQVISRRITPQDQTGLHFTLVGLIPSAHILGSVEMVQRVVTSSMLGAFVLIFLLLAIYIFRHVQPIRDLALSLSHYHPGEPFSIPERESRRNDEIGYLHRNFAGLIGQLENAFATLRERVRELADKNHKLIEATREAEQLGQAKSDFLAVMSHEIRTPLNAIVGYAKLVESETRDPECRQYCQRINANSDRLLSLIDNILDFTRISSGRTKLEIKPFFPAEELENLHLDFHDQIRSKEVQFTLTFTGNRHLALLGDVCRWHQILDNLISNALKFTEKGTVHLDARLVPFEHDPGQAWFELDVIDSGVGIPPEKLDAIFKPFEQADNSMRRRFQGTGLGLAICQRLVDLMEGTLLVRSQPGKGSCFSLRLPFATDDTIIEPDTSQETRSPSQNDLSKLAFLIVEDDEANAAVMKDHLLYHGAEKVDQVDDEGGLRKALDNTNYDCILMDTHLGQDDGMQLTQKIRNGEIPASNGRDVLIYIVSAHVDQHGDRTAKALGAQGFWSKPIHFERFLAELKKHLAVVLGNPPGQPEPPAGE